jgi:hypothetical protein
MLLVIHLNVIVFLSGTLDLPVILDGQFLVRH